MTVETRCCTLWNSNDQWNNLREHAGTSYQLYLREVTDREGRFSKTLLPPATPGGRPRAREMPMVLNALFSVSRGGSAWRYLPRAYPPWAPGYGDLRRWRQEGVWPQRPDRLRSLGRPRAGRQAQPTAALLAAQSVQTTEQGGMARGYGRGRRWRGASARSWLRCGEGCSWWESIPPACKIGREPRGSSRGLRIASGGCG